MIRHLLPIVAWLLVAASLAAAGDEIEKGFVSMFNGKDLAGWEGKPGGWWVEDGAITSRSTPEKPCTKHHYLMWRGGKPGDFELRLSYRVVGGNSGIQFRSRELPDWDTNGYQADLEAGPQWSGALFEHTRGGVAMRGTRVVIDPDGTRHVTTFAESSQLQKKIKPDDWNRYVVLARGNKITLTINGVLMSQVVDNDKQHAARSGVLALQMHPGPPMTVQFRDLQIKMLDEGS
ncbi:MAG: DUF1080 domain-containing protein [Pirellulales bacterium]|nr:DUF1080 domain-containing protein [Pirellulales bacterium]